jgi:hypothetical protein
MIRFWAFDDAPREYRSLIGVQMLAREPGRWLAWLTHSDEPDGSPAHVLLHLLCRAWVAASPAKNHGARVFPMPDGREEVRVGYLKQARLPEGE